MSAPQPGRLVDVNEFLAVHPQPSDTCLCRGRGVLTTWRNGQQGVQWCAMVLREFRRTYTGRVVDSPEGPRWLEGMEPTPHASNAGKPVPLHTEGGVQNEETQP